MVKDSKTILRLKGFNFAIDLSTNWSNIEQYIRAEDWKVK